MKLSGLKGLAAAALVLGVALVNGAGFSAADDKKLLTVKEIMKAQNKLKGEVPKDLAAGKWDAVDTKAKAWVAAAEDLTKNPHKKGTDESWKELTGKYLEETKKLSAAAGKKDADAAKAALTYLSAGDTCKGCHSKHK